MAACGHGKHSVLHEAETPLQKLDPTQFIRLNGRSMQVHLEHSVALAAESPGSMYVDSTQSRYSIANSHSQRDGN